MVPKNVRETVRFLIPQCLTGVRVVLGGIALFEAIRGRSFWAATWVTYGALTDGLDGIAARRLSVISDFGALFDLFADYVCYIVVPVALSLGFFEVEPGLAVLVILGLPLLTGAVRYARLARWNTMQPPEAAGTPGLATLIYSFFIVTLVFSRPAELTGVIWLRRAVLFMVPALSFLMVSPIRYPKLMKFHWIFYTVLVGFLIMPFVGTRLLSSITLALGFIYTVGSPFVVHPKRNSNSNRPLENFGDSPENHDLSSCRTE